MVSQLSAFINVTEFTFKVTATSSLNIKKKNKDTILYFFLLKGILAALPLLRRENNLTKCLLVSSAQLSAAPAPAQRLSKQK